MPHQNEKIKKILEKFDEKFVRKSFDGLQIQCICGKHDTGQVWGEVDDIKSFLSQSLESVIKETKKEVHHTKNGYCCACEYDIAVIDRKIKETREV